MATITRVYRTWAEFVTDDTKTVGWARIEPGEKRIDAWFQRDRPTPSQISFGARAIFRLDHEAARTEMAWQRLPRDILTTPWPLPHLTLAQIEQIRIILTPHKPDEEPEPPDPNEQIERACDRLVGIVGMRMPLLDMIRATEEHFAGVIRKQADELQALRDILAVESGCHVPAAGDWQVVTYNHWSQRGMEIVRCFHTAETPEWKIRTRGATEPPPQLVEWENRDHSWAYALVAMREINDAIRAHANKVEQSTSG